MNLVKIIDENLSQSVTSQLSENSLRVLIDQFDVSNTANRISKSNSQQNFRITLFCIACSSNLLYDSISALSIQVFDQDVAKQNYSIAA